MARLGQEAYMLSDSSKQGLRPFHAWARLCTPLDAGDRRRPDPEQVRTFGRRVQVEAATAGGWLGPDF